MHEDHFDQRAATWDDDPGHVARAHAVAAALKAALPLDSSVRLLEYGAGTGLVSQALRDTVGSITLADTSAGMRSVIEQKIATGVLAGARVWDVDLAAGPPPASEPFDLVVTVMTLHHIADVTPVLANFAALLRGGGHLAIVDLDEEDGSFHDEGFAGHHGFARTRLAEQLRDAGFATVTFETCHELERDGRRYPLFLAVASRA